MDQHDTHEADVSSLEDELLHAGWSVGMTMRSTYGISLVLRAWPDTWTTSEGPNTITVHGKDKVVALRNALKAVEERAAGATTG